MEIIKHGNLKPTHFKCARCECEFVANMTEYYLAYCDDKRYINIHCPECGVLIYELESEAKPYYGQV